MIQRLRQFIRYCFDEKPLLFCMWTAFAFRMVAVAFAQGVAFGFDHYIYIENSQNIVSGHLTFSELIMDGDNPFSNRGYSLIYLIFNTLFFYVSEMMGIFDPGAKMLVLRFFHALLSLLVIYYSYRLAYRLGNRKAALAVGIVASMLWFMPFMSVKSLPENVAAIMLLAGIYRFAKISRRDYKYGDDLFVGLLMGVSVSFCYNTILFILGFAIVVGMISGKRRSLLLLLGAAISFFLLEGVVDMALVDTPFYVFSEYAGAIIDGTLRTHGSRSIYMYISLLLMMIPLPWGALGFFGYIKSWKRNFLLFFPFTFYLVTSYLLPYKGEQFLLPVTPMFFILSLSGWFRYTGGSRFWAAHQGLSKWIMVAFFAVNTPALLLASVSYTRRPQIQTMEYLSKYKNDITSILVEDSGHKGSKSLPPFYMGKDVIIYVLNEQAEEPDPSIYYSMTRGDGNEHRLFTEKYFMRPQNQEMPQFVIFYGDYDMPERLARMREIFPQIAYEKTISPSFADKVIQLINHHNANMPLHIYRTY